MNGRDVDKLTIRKVLQATDDTLRDAVNTIETMLECILLADGKLTDNQVLILSDIAAREVRRAQEAVTAALETNWKATDAQRPGLALLGQHHEFCRELDRGFDMADGTTSVRERLRPGLWSVILNESSVWIVRAQSEGQAVIRAVNEDGIRLTTRYQSAKAEAIEEMRG
jgi:hypothetical protein